MIIRKALRFLSLNLLRKADIRDYGKRNYVRLETTLVKKSVFSLFFNDNIVSLMPRCVFDCTSVVILGSGNKITCDVGSHLTGCQIWVHGSSATVYIGKDVSLNEVKIVVTDDHAVVRVDEGTMIGPGSELRCGDGHGIIDQNTGKILNRARFIDIGKNVLISSGALILKNVTVASGAVVGARSVVTKDVAQNTLVAGAPAKVVRTEIRWTRQRIDAISPLSTHDLSDSRN